MADHLREKFGNYLLVKLLGRGSFAEVYLATHIYLGTEAAIKVLTTVLTSEEINQFRIEAHTIARLKHPYIVRVLDFGVNNGTPFLVMDYAPNGTLRQYYPKGTRLTLTTILPHIKQIATALQYAHDRNLIHRDIKPENILLEQNNDIVLSDFGIAAIAHSSRSMNTQNVIGTIPYMAPEQLQGKPRLASDQYALGVMVYELLCGQRPFNGTYWEIVTQHLSTTPPSLHKKDPTISRALEEVVMTALAKDPHQRFDSIRTFANALEQTLDTGARVKVPQPAASPFAAAPAKRPNETTLINAYKQIQAKIITDPEAIRKVAAGFLAIANDPVASKNTTVDTGLAAERLLEQARLYEEQEKAAERFNDA